MGLLTAIAVLALVTSITLATPARFDNYKVYSVQVESDEHHEHLTNLQHTSSEYSMWNAIRVGRSADIMVPPHKTAEFHELIAALNLNATLKIDNVQHLIDNERSKIQSIEFSWTDYQNLDGIYTWLDEQLANFPSILTGLEIGKSYEGRTIRAVKLSHKVGNPTIFIEANIHAREWITSATATWLLNELLTSTDEATMEIAQNFDWIIVPVFNVDGFVYTHEKNRLWRKTRQPHSMLCTGADPNRNFNRFWRQYDGASNNPCTEQFAGPNAESEPEVVAFTRFYQTIANSVKLYFAFHAYGQYILTPFGNTFIPPENNYELMTIGMHGKEAISKRYGTDYVVGSIAEVLYSASGSSIDWAYGVGNLTTLFAFEFRDIRQGSYGYILPADQIIPNSEEVLDGLKAMITSARNLGVV